MEQGRTVISSEGQRKINYYMTPYGQGNTLEMNVVAAGDYTRQTQHPAWAS